MRKNKCNSKTRVFSFPPKEIENEKQGGEREGAGRERETKRATASLPDLMVFLGPLATHMITGLQYCQSFILLRNSAYVHHQTASRAAFQKVYNQGFNIPLAEKKTSKIV